MNDIPYLDIDREYDFESTTLNTEGVLRDIAEGIGSFFGGLFGGKKEEPPPQPVIVQTQQEDTKTLMYLMFGFSALIVTILLIK